MTPLGGLGEEMNVHGWCKAKREAKMIWLEVVKNDMKGLGLPSKCGTADVLDLSCLKEDC